jgi:hypothetical protein
VLSLQAKKVFSPKMITRQAKNNQFKRNQHAAAVFELLYLVKNVLMQVFDKKSYCNTS